MLYLRDKSEIKSVNFMALPDNEFLKREVIGKGRAYQI
jgi:hypothetical protein